MGSTLGRFQCLAWGRADMPTRLCGLCSPSQGPPCSPPPSLPALTPFQTHEYMPTPAAGDVPVHELLGTMGLFGCLWSALQGLPLELHTLRAAQWTPAVLLPFLGFAAAMFAFYRRAGPGAIGRVGGRSESSQGPLHCGGVGPAACALLHRCQCCAAWALLICGSCLPLFDCLVCMSQLPGLQLGAL